MSWTYKIVANIKKSLFFPLLRQKWMKSVSSAGGCFVTWKRLWFSFIFDFFSFGKQLKVCTKGNCWIRESRGFKDSRRCSLNWAGFEDISREASTLHAWTALTPASSSQEGLHVKDHHSLMHGIWFCVWNHSRLKRTSKSIASVPFHSTLMDTTCK